MQTYNFFRNIGINLLMSVCLILINGTFSSLNAQITISELLIDPSPRVGLPNSEYIELHNITNNDIHLLNWELQIGRSKKLLPDSILHANDYIIITDIDFVREFQTSKIIGIHSFPSLSNAGTVVLLRNNIGDIVYIMQYDEDWLTDEKKQQGGWALEMIEVNNQCESSKSNYRFSEDASGGTPGRSNSWAGQKATFEALHPTACLIVNDTQLVITFSKPVDSNQLSSATNYRFIERNQSIQTASFSYNTPKSIKLTVTQNFKRNIIEHLQISLQDCNSTQKQIFTIPLSLPDSIQPGDVVINEILFDATTDDTEFIEIFNLSNKTQAVNDLYVATRFDSVGNISQITPLSKNGSLLFPGEYRAFTKDTLALKQIFPPSSIGVLSQASIPILNNEGGHIAICNKNKQIIDQLLYTQDMHYPLLKTTKGVSIERINARDKADDANNWHSASSSCGYATPGLKNSQRIDSSISEKQVILSPQCFSPDNDGIDDFGQVEFSVNQPGYTTTIQIFDLEGRLIKRLAQNTLISSPEDAIIWDATDNNHTLVRNGAYICAITLIHPQGNHNTYKLPWYIARKE